MLKLVDIKKDYAVGGGTKVSALKGVSLEFRQSEFVAVLGPSGCGKTTLLNIIGGLDHQTGGDLLIDGKSTKDYKDGDWDNYRNHRIGFVFQSYNLIPHQTILQNVELALNIGGISKAEREQKAKAALDEVGLEGQYNKKPNQLSGGQCQRVAIARALVTDPEILLADEPTGALDTETSIQVMDLLKKVSQDRIVIMVTHNPDLAKKYATRTVSLLDGLVVGDSNPFHAEKEEEPTPDFTGKAKLSLFSSIQLSFKNLLSKRKRTLMVAIAASIGIIGVSSVLAVSSGVSDFIDSMQEDMLSGSPISINSSGFDLTSILDSVSSGEAFEAVVEAVEEEDDGTGYINIDKVVESLVSSYGSIDNLMFENTITEDYLAYIRAMPEDIYAGLLVDYGIDPTPAIYTSGALDGEEYEAEGALTSLSLIKSVYSSILSTTSYSQFSSLLSMVSTPFQQLPEGDEMILSQYDILNEGGYLPTAENEIALVADNSTYGDVYLAQLGILGQDEFMNIVKAAVGEEYDEDLYRSRISYEEILDQTYYYFPNDSIYSYNELTGFTYSPTKTTSDTDGLELKITAILSPKEDISFGCLDSGLYYTEALTERMLEDGVNSEIAQYLNENELEGFTAAGAPWYNYSYTFEGATSYDLAVVYSSGLTSFSEDTVVWELSDLGGSANPTSIDIYASTLSGSDSIKAYLDVWNSDADIVIGDKTLTASERTEITYSDTLSLVLSLVDSLVDIVTTALTIFTGLSLVVSTVMIAVITYVSVIERVKEIGVIRSLGGRKKDVRRLFNAETIMIGLFAGLIGIAVTLIIEVALNALLGAVIGFSGIAALKWYQALLMIGLSVLLSWISGLIPASLAAKKDPVDALRSE